MTEVVVVAVSETVVIAAPAGDETIFVDVGADIEVVEVAEQGPPGPPGSAENVAEIVPSPILSFENALI